MAENEALWVNGMPKLLIFLYRGIIYGWIGKVGERDGPVFTAGS